MGNPNEGFREQDERDLELQGLLSGVRAPNKEQRARKEKKGLALYSWLEDDDNEGSDVRPLPTSPLSQDVSVLSVVIDRSMTGSLTGSSLTGQ